MPPRKFDLPPIYPITDRNISGLSHESQLRSLFEGGARIAQIRDKTASSRVFFDSVRRCIEMRKRSGGVLIVNDRVDVALILEADGVHVGQDDLPPSEARKLLGEDAIIGFSTHNLDQVRKGRSQPIDYIAFGPVFETATKHDRETAVGLDRLKRVRDEIGDLPLVAIGGIDHDNLRSVLEAGADSAAMISALLNDPGMITENIKKSLEIADFRR
jgi:thiamine-phosphate pyrophosphorylase